MRLQLSNTHEQTSREIVVPGNPLLTYEHLRAGAADPADEGSTMPVLRYWEDAWQLLEDASKWTDVEVLPDLDVITRFRVEDFFALTDDEAASLTLDDRREIEKRFLEGLGDVWSESATQAVEIWRRDKETRR